MNLFLRNLLAIFFATMLSILLTKILNAYSPLVSQDWLYGILFLAGTSFILNLIYAFNAGSKEFTELLFAALVIKLLLALIAIVVFSFFRTKAVFFGIAIQFILHYILFTIFEIRYLFHIIKTHPLKHN